MAAFISQHSISLLLDQRQLGLIKSVLLVITGWLVGWLVGLLLGCLVVWLVGWLVGWLFVWLVGNAVFPETTVRIFSDFLEEVRGL